MIFQERVYRIGFITRDSNEEMRKGGWIGWESEEVGGREEG